MLPKDPIDELIHRAHDASDGAPAGFAGRMHARLLAEDVTRRHTRVVYMQAAVAVAAVVVLALLIGVNVQLFIPSQPAEQPQPDSATGPAVNEPAPKTPVQVPEPQDPVEKTPTDPKPEPGDPDQPKPEEPRTPDESPKPEPETQPEKPDEVIEKPEPTPAEPEGTEVKPEQPAPRAVMISVIGDPKLRVKYGSEEWRDYAGESLNDGVLLSAGRDPVDLALADGGLARFNGEVRFTVEDEVLCFTVSDDSLYADNLGTGREVKVLANDHAANMPDGAGVFYHVSNGMEVACLAGAVSLDGTNVEVGMARRATARGVGDAKAFKGDRFLKDLPPRVLLREDFVAAPPGGMYEEGERLENGIAVMDKAPRYIAFRHNPTFTVLPGTVLRMRLRATDVSKLELELFTVADIKLLKRNEELMFKHIWSPGDNEWQEIELRLEDVALKDNPERKLTAGELLRNFKLHFVGKKLEIDWVEFVRVQE